MSKVLYNNFNLLRLLAALQVVYLHTVEHLHIKNEIVLFIGSIISYFPGVPIVNMFLYLNYFGNISYCFMVVVFTFLFALISWKYIEGPVLAFKKHSLNLIYKGK